MREFLDRLEHGKHKPPRFPYPMWATVWDATLTTVTFRLPTLGGRHVYGPAPYPRCRHETVEDFGPAAHTHALHDPAVPPRGTPCAVVWIEGGADPRLPESGPVVVMFHGWP